MGLFDFLKTTVKSPTKKPGAAGGRKGGSIVVDGKSFPLSVITPKGFATSGFDGSLIAGQNARITVTVDDSYGRFGFSTTVIVSEADNTKCVGAWMMLAPEHEAAIRKYNQNKKASGK